MSETLDWTPALERPHLLAPAVAKAIETIPALSSAQVTQIDPALSDTEKLCGHYDVPLDQCGNCVVVAGRRGEQVTLAACLVLATTRADVNGVVRRHLDARKASFAPMDDAVELTGMEYGGITPIGLPASWSILVDSRVIAMPHVIIGSGVRHSKIAIAGPALGALPGAEVIEGLARDAI